MTEPKVSPVHINGARRPLILSRPEKQTTAQRWGSRGFTAVAWLIWFYLIVPVLSLIAWVVGLAFIYVILLQGLDIAELKWILSRYGLGIGILTGTYLLWALYSWLRFRKAKRRQYVEIIYLDEIAEAHEMRLSRLHDWRFSKRETVDQETLERIMGADTKEEWRRRRSSGYEP